MKVSLLATTTSLALQAVDLHALKVLTSNQQTPVQGQPASMPALAACTCVNAKSTTALGEVGTDQKWLTQQDDDTEYGKLYASGGDNYFAGGVKDAKGLNNYGEFCAAWEDVTADLNDGTNSAKGVAGMNKDCADTATRPNWCSKKWCYVRLETETPGTVKIERDPLDSNAPGNPVGPGCTGLSDVTFSKIQDSYIWYSYQMCEKV
ncbi:unnamed protein product [Amoebophrya sp. A120]|nr:unnamed protein product [Amoebophrya sp. A120]|eukprot:GSA120T00012167001.1